MGKHFYGDHGTISNIIEGEVEIPINFILMLFAHHQDKISITTSEKFSLFHKIKSRPEEINKKEMKLIFEGLSGVKEYLMEDNEIFFPSKDVLKAIAILERELINLHK